MIVLRARPARLPAALPRGASAHRRPLRFVAVAADGGLRVVARWSVDARFGCKAQAAALVRASQAVWHTPRTLMHRTPLLAAWQLAEWVANVASQAGVAAADTRLLSGQLGAPESRLELELCFASLADLERFFAELPPNQHAAWGARFAAVVLDGSPSWHVLRVLDVSALAGGPSAGDLVPDAAPPPPAPELPPAVRRPGSKLFVPVSEETAVATETPELDWKGDPVQWAPGDKRPKFTS